MLVAFQLASQCLPSYSNKFSRHDFTLQQLFACLVVREHQKKSYRGVEALLRDAPDWCHQIGMSHVPDHNTLCRAFGLIVTKTRVNRMLDLTSQFFKEAKELKLSIKPLVLDSSYFESHHVSRHFEHRQAQSQRQEAKKQAQKSGKPVPSTRSATHKRLPKLGLAVASACHAILAVKVKTGSGSDHRWLEPLLFDAWKRVQVTKVAADAGFDCEANHRIARLDMGVRTLIPADIGRPTAKPPTGRYRRLSRRLLKTKRGRQRSGYTQRWQVETTNSMIKRNLGSALRARTEKRRERELLLRAITHNIMLMGEG